MTTKGAVEFVGDERRILRRRSNRGSIFEGSLRLTNPEFEKCCNAMQRLISPVGIKTFFNGELLSHRQSLAVIERIPLRTEITDAEGYLRPTTRQTEIHIHESLPGETGTLFEMGIPIVETGDDYHVDVQQKVPLNSDRDNLPPSYLRTVRIAVLNKIHPRFGQEAANHVWVRHAMEDDVSEEAVRTVIRKRFGEKVVSFDPRTRKPITGRWPTALQSSMGALCRNLSGRRRGGLAQCLRWDRSSGLTRRKRNRSRHWNRPRNSGSSMP